MNLLIICLLIIVILPFLAKMPLGFAMHQLGGYDNSHPREQQAKLHGFGARALAAHQNSFEALSVFSAAVLTTITTHHISFMAQLLAVIFIVTRLIYHVVYLMNFATVRSITWFIGYLCCLIMLGQCIF